MKNSSGLDLDGSFKSELELTRVNVMAAVSAEFDRKCLIATQMMHFNETGFL
jgi:hypothetical protein